MAKELLKEAIADAKAVREVDLENAKMALEEAFDSKIKNMLSAKLAEELEEDVELEETYMEDEKDEDMKEGKDDEKDEDMKEAYHEDEKDEDMKEEFELEEDEEINLDELMAELEEMGGLEEGKDDEKDEDMKEGKDDEKDEDMKEGQVNEIVGLAVVGSIIAAAGGLNAFLEKGRAGKLSGKAEKVYQGLEGAVSGAAGARRSEGVENLEETLDIDALISEIEADLDEETVDEGATGYDEKVGGKGRTGYDEKVGGKGRTGYDGAVKKLKEERDEALETVASLQETISEMNLLNSKLLYCNKLFRANALTENQKVKVVDALDKASTTGEAKLVFETLQESFAFTGVEKRAIKEGLGRASKATGVAPTNVITESVDETVSRFQKLANINK